jgi:hypothetical protein
MAPSLMTQTAQSYRDMGSFPTEPAPKSAMTQRILEHAASQGLDGEILDRLPHSGAFAHYRHQLAIARYGRLRPPNYTVLSAFQPSLLLNYNLDGLATTICSDQHVVVPMHGSVDAYYGSLAGANLARVLQEYPCELPYDELHPVGPELITDRRLQYKLRYMNRSRPAFIMIVGYSFGRFANGYDDEISRATFIRRFRDVPLDIYICDPFPFELASMLGEELRSKRIHLLPVYWNIMAWAFSQVLIGTLDVGVLASIHEKILDRYGSTFLPDQDVGTSKWMACTSLTIAHVLKHHEWE